MAESKKRIALKPHMRQIREWVEGGKTDEWIGDALGTSASSVQSFRSRNDIYRRDRGSRESMSVFEGVLDHGERDGWGLWFDPSVADDPIWREHWSGVESVVVKVAQDAIVLESAPATATLQDGTDNDAITQDAITFTIEAAPAVPESESPAAEPPAGGSDEVSAETGSTEAEQEVREQGRVKWFDAEKGYGFLVRPTGEDLFVHHSEVEGDASVLGPGGEVEYVVGRNDRGPNARSVRLLG